MELVALVLVLEGSLAPLVRNHKMNLYWCGTASAACRKQSSRLYLVVIIELVNLIFVFLQGCILSGL